MARTRGGRRRHASKRPISTWRPIRVSRPFLTFEDVLDIIRNDQWIIEGITRHWRGTGPELRPLRISPDFCFLVSWADSVWDTSNTTINAFMQSKVRPISSESPPMFVHGPNQQIKEYEDHIIHRATDEDHKSQSIMWRSTWVPLKHFNKGDANEKLKEYCTEQSINYDSLTQYMNQD